MADEPEEIEVAAPEGDISEVVEPPKVVEPDEGIATLQANLAAAQVQLAEANAARDAAERRARDAGKTATEKAQETAEANLAMVSNAIDSVKQSLDVAEASYAAALESGDFAGAAKIQREMATHAAKLQTMENGKASMEAEAKNPRPVVQEINDPVEALAVQLSPRSAGWVRAHPEFARDSRLYQKMLAAHNLAVADGVEADSDAYFEAIETTLKVRAPAVAAVVVDEALSEAAAPRREVAPPAAPAGRGNGTDRTVRLSAAQVEMAQISGLTNEEYAAQLVRARKNGEIQ